ncbi:MAG: protein kinase [Chloroflexi bacterium]|nr:protein kinase [Chloroflexota bacterium]
MLGQVLVNRYRIDAELGKGGMGIVYRGYDTLLDREVAVKLISSVGLGTEGRTRLLVEARAAARLNHPNIVTIYDAVDEGEKPFIIMELVEGKTLRSTPAPNMENCIEYARQICAALAHAHGKGIIHRDLKPENAMLTPDNIVKLMDFGLARSTNAPRVTASGVIVGTISYIAPELIESGEASAQSDLYALGVMMFEMLTGSQPYKGTELIQLIFQHMNAPIPSPREVRLDIPAALDALVMKMMSKKPEDRPASAFNVELTLASLQSDQARSTEAIPTDNTKIQALPKLAEKRAQAQVSWDKKWQKKGYSKSSLPVLEPTERPLILSNREKELAKGVGYLKDHRLLIVNGMPGIGKSTFARALLEFMPVESPPPFWYDFERQQSSGNTLGVLLDRISSYLENCLGGEVRQEVMAFRNSPEGQASAYEVDVLIDYLNQETPIWLVFDNLETVLSRGSNHFNDEGLELLFDGLKSNTHNARIIVTNPFVPVLHNGQFLLEFGTQPLTLRGLTESDSISFLRVFGLDKFPEDMLVSLARTADGHPFTLNHLAHYIQALGVTSAVGDLQGGLEETTERFKVSLQQRLSPQEFNALQSITILHREISLEGLCQTAQATPGIIKRLREEGLLQASDTGKFWLPGIVKTSLKSPDPEFTQQAHLRATSFYRSQKISPARQSIDDYASILEWHHHAAQARDAASSYAALFSTGLKDQLMAWNEYTLLAELCEGTLSITSSDHKEFSKLEWVTIQQTLGIIHFLLRKYTQSIACLKTAVISLGPGENTELRIRLLIDLAESHSANGDFVTAMDICQESMKALSTIQKEDLLAKALLVRGVINRGQGNMEQAMTDLEDSLKLYERINDQTGIAYVTGELGIVYYYQNHFAKALANYKRALNLCKAKHDMRGTLIGHFNIGDILLQDEQYELAIKELQAAWEMAHKRKLLNIESMAGLYVIEARLALLQLDKVEEDLNKLHNLISTQASPGLSGQELVLQAGLHWKRKQFGQAKKYFDGAFSLLKDENCKYELARAYLAFADFLKNQGNLYEARTALQNGREIFIALNNNLGLQTIEKAFKAL